MIDKNKPRALTIEYSGIVDELATECGVCAGYSPELEQGDNFPAINIKAIWDTGATESVISTDVVRALNLEPDGIANMFHANGKSIVCTYFVNIILPNNVGFYSKSLAEGILSDMDVLIGMDIISKGDFCVTTSKGKTKFSFQIPSTHDIDFVKECD